MKPKILAIVCMLMLPISLTYAQDVSDTQESNASSPESINCSPEDSASSIEDTASSTEDSACSPDRVTDIEKLKGDGADRERLEGIELLQSSGQDEKLEGVGHVLSSTDPN